MYDLIIKVLAAPINTPLLMILAVAYTIIESIRIYDVRLIQAKTKGLFSRVAFEAQGRCLPKWVGYIHLIGWILIIIILVINWMFAILLYVILFILRVLPVLERIGALIMHPFLQFDSGDF